jgi:hypothetical protein
MAGLAEQRQNPPDLSDLHYALIGKIEEVETDLKATAEAQDSFVYLAADMDKLVIPAEIGRALAAVGLWLNSHAGATGAELETLQDAERDLMF